MHIYRVYTTPTNFSLYGEKIAGRQLSKVISWGKCFAVDLVYHISVIAIT